MFAMGVVELLIFPVLALLVLYGVIRLAVKHGTVDAARHREADAVRRQQGVGPERSPNSRP
ncbi:hypothetical protein [Nocardioides cynanchi]|uniref:hypothetical protein n=1 Tax=Nocardioides cynanchi TaxID=2558918 RepID=UPI001780ACFA|nr:hypothetical protein [Nocardioides cynanchi]